MNSSGRMAALSLAAALVACGSSGNDGGSGAQQNCTPVNACHEGIRDSSGACVDLNVAVADGTACGTQMVCSAGTCVAACVAGQACQAANPCRVGSTTCASPAAAPVCSESGNRPDGTGCGNANVCSGGSCVAPTCTAGLDCQPENACTNGATTCPTPLSVPGCRVTGNKPDGTGCGSGNVCSGGSCMPVACTPGAACDPADPCDVGQTVCTSPTSPGTCSRTGNRPDGTPCGFGLVCTAGTCGAACVAGQACQPTNPCAIGTTACASSWATATCSTTGNKADGTACGTGLVCSAGACVAADTTRPTVVLRTPAPGATNVWSRDAIIVRFSEKMAAATFTDASVTVAASGINIAKVLTPSADGYALTITPLSLPVPPFALTVHLATTIADLAGNPLSPPADTWRWDVPAWQALGDIPVSDDDVDFVPIVAAEPSGTIWTAVQRHGLHGDAIHLFRYESGFWDRLPDAMRANSGLGTVSFDVDGKGTAAVSWTFDDGAPGSRPLPYVSQWTGTGWTTPYLLATSGTAQDTRVRFDASRRLVAAWNSTSDASSPSYFYVARRDAGTWTRLGAEVATSSVYSAQSWNVSFDASNEPQVGWNAPTTFPEYFDVALTRWNGSSWNAFDSAWFSVSQPPVLPLATPSGEIFGAWWSDDTPMRLRASRHRVHYDVCDPAYDLFTRGRYSLAPPELPPIDLDPHGYPVAVWLEQDLICGKRWDGSGWQPLASSVPCTGIATGHPNSVYARSGVIAVCYAHFNPSDRWWMTCARYNDYVYSAPVPLTSILINDAQGATTEIPFPTAFRVAYTPANATTKTLTWRVCADHPVACTPDPTGHCRTCTPSTTNGTITSSGVYTPPATVPASPTRVYVTACQVEQAICDWSYVDVSR